MSTQRAIGISDSSGISFGAITIENHKFTPEGILEAFNDLKSFKIINNQPKNDSWFHNLEQGCIILGRPETQLSFNYSFREVPLESLQMP